MKVPVWAADLAAAFWSAAGEPEPFPRSLRHSIARALPLTVVSLPTLGIEAASRWLEKMKTPCRIEMGDRPLHGMLVTLRGMGFVFLNGADDEDEQRFSLAHELAHYLRDYHRPRERVRRHLGDLGLEMLDGIRPATVDERIVGAIESLPLQCQVHLLERHGDGTPATTAIGSAERDADRLAFELLAPAWHLAQTGLFQKPQAEWHDRLRTTYGLPCWAAAKYVAIAKAAEPRDSFLDSLTKAMRR